MAINVANLAAAEAEWRRQGYGRIALHERVPNHREKKPFLSEYSAVHDLMLLGASGRWPLELTCHGRVTGRNEQLIWGPEAIALITDRIEECQEFMQEGLGFRVGEDGMLVLPSRFPGWRCRIALEASATHKTTTLSAEGPSCLAFYTNRPELDAQRLMELGGTDFTGCFSIELGERYLTIAMVRAPGGAIIELIGVKARS